MTMSFSAGAIPGSAVVPDSSSAAVTPDILQTFILSVGSVPACPAEWKSRVWSGPGVLEQMHTLGSKMGQKEKESVKICSAFNW